MIFKKANRIVTFCTCAHAHWTVHELTVIEPFGIGEVQRFVFEQAVVGLKQLFQIHRIAAFVA